jgi:hypothetical protein
MEQLTIRGFSKELQEALQSTAKKRGISLNKAALFLMRRGAGLRSPEESHLVVGNSLDAYFGTMSKEDADAVERAADALDSVPDEAFWK